MNLRLPISDCRFCAILLLIAAATTGCTNNSLRPSSTAPVTQPEAGASAEELAAWKEIRAKLGKEGAAADHVYTVTFPRDDLFVSIEGMDVPAAAGISSIFHFYRCSCGKTVVLGQFVLADYEANDVVWALEKQDFVVSSVGPFLSYEKPRLIAVRFQAEGQPRRLAEALRDALNRTGRNRLSSQSVN